MRRLNHMKQIENVSEEAPHCGAVDSEITHCGAVRQSTSGPEEYHCGAVDGEPPHCGAVSNITAAMMLENDDPLVINTKLNQFLAKQVSN